VRSRMARWLVRLYPHAWRVRYEEEFLAMLEQRSASVWDLLDVALGVLDAWLRPQVMSERRIMVQRMRGSVLAVLWAWVGLVVAGVGFQKMTEYGDFVRAARENTLVGGAFDAVVIGAVAAMVAICVGGAPIAFAAARSALAEGRRDVPLLLCLPVLSLAIFVGYTLLIVRVIDPALERFASGEATDVTLLLSLAVVFVLAAVASVGAVSAAIRRSEIAALPIRFAIYPSAVAAVAMLVVLVGAVVWGLALRAQAPALFAGDEGIASASTSGTWMVIVTVMAVSTAVAIVAAIRGLRARSLQRPAGRPLS